MSKVHPHASSEYVTVTDTHRAHGEDLKKDLKDTLGMIKVVQLLSRKDLLSKHPRYKDEIEELKNIIGHSNVTNETLLDHKKDLLYLFETFDFCKLRSMKSSCEKRKGTRKYVFRRGPVSYMDRIRSAETNCELRDALLHIVSTSDFVISFRRMCREKSSLQVIKKHIRRGQNEPYVENFSYIFEGENVDYETPAKDNEPSVNTNIQRQLEEALHSTKQAEEAIESLQGDFHSRSSTPSESGRVLPSVQTSVHEVSQRGEKLRDVASNTRRLADVADTLFEEAKKLADEKKNGPKGWFRFGGRKTRRQTRRHHKK